MTRHSTIEDSHGAGRPSPGASSGRRPDRLPADPVTWAPSAQPLHADLRGEWPMLAHASCAWTSTSDRLAAAAPAWRPTSSSRACLHGRRPDELLTASASASRRSAWRWGCTELLCEGGDFALAAAGACSPADGTTIGRQRRRHRHRWRGRWPRRRRSGPGRARASTTKPRPDVITAETADGSTSSPTSMRRRPTAAGWSACRSSGALAKPAVQPRGTEDVMTRPP